MFQSEFRIGPALIFAAGVSWVAGCAGGPGFSESSASPTPGQHQPVSTETEPAGHDDAPPAHGEGSASASPHWSYGGSEGPSRWAFLSPDFATCGSGLRQSPIDLNSTRSRDLDPLDLRYRSTNLGIVNNGHTIQINHFGDSFVSIDHWPYRLRQFHFHAPSEHTIEGRHAEMEMHLVHVGEWGRLAVVGVMIEEGEHNPAFDQIWNRLPAEPGEAELFDDAFVDPRVLLPADREYYHYSGSLTTPPCTEDVNWFVLREPITMSREQISRFREIVDGNNRPVQPLNGRKVVVRKR